MEQHPWTSIGLLLESYDLPISACRSKLAQTDRETAMSELKKKLSLHPRKPRVKNAKNKNLKKKLGQYMMRPARPPPLAMRDWRGSLKEDRALFHHDHCWPPDCLEKEELRQVSARLWDSVEMKVASFRDMIFAGHSCASICCLSLVRRSIASLLVRLKAPCFHIANLRHELLELWTSRKRTLKQFYRNLWYMTYMCHLDSILAPVSQIFCSDMSVQSC